MDEKLVRLLRELNPFWIGNFSVEYFDRDIYEKIARVVGEKQIIALSGLRRVGKTTLLDKIIFDLLKKNAKKEEILYFSFDGFEGNDLFEIIDACKEINGIEPKFLFFDEVQKVEGWHEKVKLLYDTKKYKLFVSGSESLFLKKGAKESLAGRIFEFEVKTLSFKEFLVFSGKTEWAEKPLLFDFELRTAFNDYLLSGGFPEMIGKKDPALVRNYIKSAVVEKVVFIDLPRLFPVDDPQKLYSLLEVLIDNPGMLVDYSSLSKQFGLSRQTVSNYFFYLEQANLVKKLYNFSKNKMVSEKKLKKYYPTFLSSALITNAEFGKLAESVCAINLKTNFFWRDPHKNEVDFILPQEKNLLPIELKYRNSPKENTGIIQFCKKYSCKKAIILTKDSRKKTKNQIKIDYVPVYEFLLKN